MDKQELMGAEHRLRCAMLLSDIPELDALIDERLIFVDGEGRLLRKSQDLALHSSGAIRLSKLEIEDLVVEVQGSVAVTALVADIAGSFQGVPFARRCRYMRTWIRTRIGWRVLAGSMHDHTQ